MRSKLFIGGLCMAGALFVGVGAAHAQSEVDLDSGKLKAEQCRTYNLTTTSSTILDVTAAAFQSVDVDITVTVEDGDDSGTERDVVAESVSTTDAYERLAIGLAGSTTYEITICNLGTQQTRFTAVFNTVAATGIGSGPARVRPIGEFTMGEVAGDPVLAEIQQIVQRRAAAKR